MVEGWRRPICCLDQDAVTIARRPISQTKPESSRAMATTTTLGCLPDCVSFRNRLHNRSCASQARSMISLGRPSCRIWRSEEHTSELQSLMRISYAVFCLKKKKHKHHRKNIYNTYK